MNTKKNNWLNEKNKGYQSQNGEDGIIEAIFETIDVKNGWVVEFGAWDGRYNSNTIHFIESGKFSGVLIEGDKPKYDQLKESFKSNERIFPVHAFVGWEGESSLDSLLAKTPIPKEFELISIDIDGNDYYVWEAMKTYSAKVVVIEYNPTIPNEVDFVQEKNFRLNHGNSVAALTRLAKSKGYELVATTVNNAFFVKSSLFPKFEIADNSVHALRTPDTRITYFFSGYDGTVFLRGHDKLDLHNLPLKEKRFQLLPKSLRGYDSQKGITKILYSFYKSLRKRDII
jgi:hypothetical protein